MAETSDEANTRRQERQSFEIRSVVGKITAASIARNGNAGAAIQIQQDRARANLYRFLDSEGDEHPRWKVELKDGKLLATFSALHDNPKRWIHHESGCRRHVEVAAAKRMYWLHYHL